MLRFISIDGQILEGEKAFAFFDTVTDTFVTFDGTCVFDDWDDFLDYWRSRSDKSKWPDLERFYSLIPKELRPATLPEDDSEAKASVMSSFVEFARAFDHTLKVNAVHEEIIRAYLRGKTPREFGRSWYRKIASDNLTNSALLGMKENQKFALCSPDGVRVFQLVEIRRHPGLKASNIIIDDAIKGKKP